MNVKLLRKVAKHILAEPKRFVMRTFCVNRAEVGGDLYADDHFEPVRFARCGTAACIGGWACILTDQKRIRNYERRAGKVLGLTPEEGQRLMFMHAWPAKFMEQFANAHTPRRRVRIAANRIEHFIKTGE